MGSRNIEKYIRNFSYLATNKDDAIILKMLFHRAIYDQHIKFWFSEPKLQRAVKNRFVQAGFQQAKEPCLSEH